MICSLKPSGWARWAIVVTAAPLRAGVTPTPTRSLVGRFLSSGMSGKACIGLRALTTVSLEDHTAKAAEAAFSEPSYPAAVALMAAVMARPEMEHECDACCLRAALMVRLVGQCFRAAGPRRRRATRTAVEQGLGEAHEGRLVRPRDARGGPLGLQGRWPTDDGRRGDRHRVDWVGRTPRSASRRRQRMGGLERGGWVCECGGARAAGESEAASRRFWEGQGMGRRCCGRMPVSWWRWGTRVTTVTSVWVYVVRPSEVYFPTGSRLRCGGMG